MRRLTSASAWLYPADDIIRPGFPLGAMAALYGTLALFVIPWLVREGGIPALYMALIAIAAPLLVVTLGRRFWIAKEVLGVTGAADMLGAWFGRAGKIHFGYLWAAGALVVLLPLLALVLLLAGHFAAAMTGSTINREMGACLFALLLSLGTAPAGLAASADMGRVVGVIVIAGAITVAALFLTDLGGVDGLAVALAQLPEVRPWGSTGGRGGGAFNQAHAVAGSIQVLSGLGTESHQGALWTGALVFSMGTAFAGLLFLLTLPWLFASPDPRLTTRHGLSTGFWMGLVALLSALFIGIGGLSLAPPGAVPALGAGEISGAFAGNSIPAVLADLAGGKGWKGLILTLTGLAVLYAFAANLVVGVVSGLSGLWAPRTGRPSDEDRALWISRIAALTSIAGALLTALSDLSDLPRWGGLAMALGLQLCVPFAAICWLPALSGRAVSAGLIAALAATLATVPLGHPLFAAFGWSAWPAWPLTIHPALWALAANLAVCFVVMVLERDAEGQRARRELHRHIRELGTAGDSGEERTGPAWLATILWIFFALGPGTVIGNGIFGSPGLAPNEWDFGVPSIIAWQLLAWISGLALLVYLSRRGGPVQFSPAQIAAVKKAKLIKPA
ncbi:MAG: hypothetical protein VYE18_07305 [Pseudomonadota bacterium]|nr:hypothetical protein [Pseudomonadota bacterium]